MSNSFILKSAIPTYSESNCIINNGDIYFSSHTNVYRTSKNTISLYTNVEGTILNMAINSNNIFICTRDRLYMNYGEIIIGSLKRSATAIDASESFFAIGHNNVLEVWDIPCSYKFTLFNIRARITGHSRPITVIKIIDDIYILTASDDNTVRLFNIKTRRALVILKTQQRIINMHIIDKSKKIAIITTERGNITEFSYENTIANDISNTTDNTNYNRVSSIIKSIDLENNIICSATYNNFLVISIANKNDIKDKKVETDHFHFNEAELQLNNLNNTDSITRPLNKSANNTAIINKSTVIIYKDLDEIYRAAVEHKIDAISFYKNNISFRTRDFVGVFNFTNENYIIKVDLPKIINMNSTNNLIAASCSDRRVRIYSGNSIKAVLFDSNSSGDILDSFICNNSCICFYKSGFISAFNIADNKCYRSFCIGNSSNSSLNPMSSDISLASLSYTHCAVSSDGLLGFIASNLSISVIDIQRSKKVDEISLDSPLNSLIFHRDILYYLDLKNVLCKYNIYNSKSTLLDINNTANSFCVRDNILAVATNSGIVVYDIDFNYKTSINVLLEGRHKEESYSRKKGIERISMDSNYIYCGGQTNQVKIIQYKKENNNIAVSLTNNNNVVQICRVSDNKDWENYKEKLLKESKETFNKGNFIETRKIIANENRFCLLSREGIKFYEKNKSNFNPLEFNIILSEEFILNNIKTGNYTAALIAGTQMQNVEFIRKVIYSAHKSTDDNKLKFLASSIINIENILIKLLFNYLAGIIKADYKDIKMMQFIKWMLFYYKNKNTDSSLNDIIDLKSLLEDVKEGTKIDYEYCRSNFYMLENINNRK